VLEVTLRGREQFVVLHVPDRLGRRSSRDAGQVDDELAEPDVRAVFDQLGERPKDFPLELGIGHGSVSPIVGRWPTGCERVRITSTRIVAPGSNLATRVARVTPS